MSKSLFGAVGFVILAVTINVGSANDFAKSGTISPKSTLIWGEFLPGESQESNAHNRHPLDAPFGIDFNAEGAMFLVELSGGRVFKRNNKGQINRIAGAKQAGYLGDGGMPDSATFQGMHNIAVTPNGDIYIADSWNHCVRKIDRQTNLITTFAGTGKAGFGGDGGLARNAEFNYVMCITLNMTNDGLYIADLKNRRIRKIDLNTNIVSTVAGNGQKGVPVNGAVAVESPLVDPRAVAIDSKHRVYILERGGHALRVVENDGTIKTVAGTGEKGFLDGAALQAQFNSPKHLCVDKNDDIYIADDQNGRIRKFIASNNKVKTVFGGGIGTPPIHLKNPHGVCIEKGALYVVDTGNNRIFRVEESSNVAAKSHWKKHLIHEGEHTNTAIAADFTGDGKPDVIASSGGKTRLFVAPDWKQVILLDKGIGCIHSEVMDVDQDGDPDWIGARYQPGYVFWLECPAKPTTERWKMHLVSEQLNGIHGLLIGDVDRDGTTDLLANSAQPVGVFPNSLAWLRVPPNPHQAARWETYIFGQKDAPGLSHYLGFGDVNGDGRPDAASAAKGGPSDKSGKGNWFAWWEAPTDPRKVWTKHVLHAKQPGATNIHPADVNSDGKVDFIASRGHGNGVLWFEAPTWQTHDIHATIQEPHCLTVIDLDQDGDIDAATCAFGSKQAAWFENDGKGHFTTHIVGENQEAYDIRAIDMDGDDDLDLLIAGRGSRNVVWYENPMK